MIINLSSPSAFDTIQTSKGSSNSFNADLKTLQQSHSPPPPPPPPPTPVNTGWSVSKTPIILPKPPSDGNWYTQDSTGKFVAQPKPAANAVINDPEWGPVYAATGLPVTNSNSTNNSTNTLTGKPVVPPSTNGGSSFYDPNIPITQQKWFLPIVVLGGAFIMYKMFKKKQA